MKKTSREFNLAAEFPFSMPKHCPSSHLRSSTADLSVPWCPAKDIMHQEYILADATRIRFCRIPILAVFSVTISKNYLFLEYLFLGSSP